MLPTPVVCVTVSEPAAWSGRVSAQALSKAAAAAITAIRQEEEGGGRVAGGSGEEGASRMGRGEDGQARRGGAGPALKASFLEKALCRSERVADTQIHTGRAGVGHTRRAADQADAGAVLVVHTRQPCVQRGALGEQIGRASCRERV